jgi:ABC-type glycerol-3-phosphate transport system substrate-binding protein
MGYVADITAEANAAMGQLNPASVNFNNFGGKIYGVPYTAGTTILYYNKAIFDKYGLKPPAAWAEMETICRTLIANNVIPLCICIRRLLTKTVWVTPARWLPAWLLFPLLLSRFSGL